MSVRRSRLQCVFEICDELVHRLHTNGQTDNASGECAVLALALVCFGVEGRQAVNPAPAGSDLEHIQC